MTVSETNSLILNAIDKIARFLISNPHIGKDFREFSQVEYKNVPTEELRNRTLTYLFSRRISHKSVFDFYIENAVNLSNDEISIVRAIQDGFVGVFEIKKLLQDGFELYSLINERNYTVKTIGARTTFRGVYVGAYLYACLCKINDEYFVCDARAVTDNDKEGGAQRYAISKIVQNPHLVFHDNPEKFAEIQQQIEKFDKDFADCFSGYEVVTTNKFADTLINAFNDYCEAGSDDIKDIVKDGIPQPEKFKYFPTKDFHFTTEDIEKKSVAGFSSQGSEYDVGLVFVKGSGFFAIPFYATFCKIFEVEDYKTIENYRDCVRNFLHNDKIPSVILEVVYKKYPEFLQRINEIMGTHYSSFEGLCLACKPTNPKDANISSAAILYSSKVFAKLMLEEKKKQQATVQKVGRNDPCPCGSGKKYKKCCMLKNA